MFYLLYKEMYGLKVPGVSGSVFNCLRVKYVSSEMNYRMGGRVNEIL
jgi:hypothetical protein